MQLWDNPNKEKQKERWKKYYLAPFSPSPLHLQMELLAAAVQMFICVFSLVIGGF